MEKSLVVILFMCFSQFGIGQENGNTKKDTLLKKLSENACKCIDSIDTKNKGKDEITKETGKCIDVQAAAYQVGSKLMNVDLVSLSNAGNQSIDINIDLNKNSNDYKQYYYEMERYLMNNCNALKMKVGANDIENDKSVSNNPEAVKEYSSGIVYFKNEEYEKALPYFEKAVKIDSVFAFAWDNMGICNRKLNNIDAAIYDYNRSLALDPNGIMPLQNIAVAYEYKKEYDKAIASYVTLSELDSFNPEVYYGIGRIYTVYLNNQGKGLENMCKAYNLYVKQKSPYRTDAETIINQIYTEMKKRNMVTQFNEILKQNNINADFK